jgi:hypothetical protein
LSNQLLTREIQPTSIDGTLGTSRKSGSGTHVLVDLRKSDLKIRAVSKITVSADDTSNTTTEIGLSIKSLFNGFNCKIGITTISNFPESNLRITS